MASRTNACPRPFSGRPSRCQVKISKTTRCTVSGRRRDGCFTPQNDLTRRANQRHSFIITQFYDRPPPLPNGLFGGYRPNIPTNEVAPARALTSPPMTEAFTSVHEASRQTARAAITCPRSSTGDRCAVLPGRTFRRRPRWTSNAHRSRSERSRGKSSSCR